MRRDHGSRLATAFGRLVWSTVVALFLLASGSAIAEEEPAPRATPTQKPVPLDLLLRLPTGSSFEVETYGGQTRSEWRSRFTRRIREHEDAKEALTDSQDKLSKIASKTDGWNLGAPGSTGGSVDPDAPLSFELNQQIRRQKKELAEAEEALESLRVEANLARVPEEWRQPAEAVEKTAVSDGW